MCNPGNEEIIALFPQIARIGNPDWTEKICEAWRTVLRQSSWNSLAECCFYPPVPGVTLVHHINAVTNACIALAGTLMKDEGIDINMDVLIASAILHDLDKPLMFEEKDGKPGFSEFYEKYQHGFYGAMVAKELGFPDSVVTNIITHTAASAKLPSNFEGYILVYVDLIDMDWHRLGSGISVNLSKFK